MNMKLKRFFGVILSLALVIGLMPGMSLTVYAYTETLLTTITATGTEQASYNPENVASVSFSNLPNCSSSYAAIWGWWGYGWTATVTPADGYTITKCVFYDDKDRTATDSEAPFVVETTEQEKEPRVNGTPILAYTSKGIKKIEVYGYATPSHSHNFTYTASGATITATCEDGCPDGYNTNGIAVTLSASNNLSYDGNAKEAVISGYPETAPEGLALAPTGVTYYKSAGKDSTTPDGNALAGAPSDCGNYVAQMTWGEKTASVAFSIIPGTINASADDVTLDYDGTAHGISVNVTNPASGYTIKYGETSDGCTLDSSLAITNVKDSPKTVYYKVTAPNYNDITGFAKITINKADQTAPSAPTKESATGTSITLAEVEGYEYKMNDGKWQESPTFTGLEAGTSYTFYQRLKGDDNHNPSDSSSGIDISTLGAISAKVTFKVENGAWDDDTSADKTITLNGYEGDELKLSTAQIPAVGSKPNDTYKAGSWDTTPSTDTAITEATTYTYTYVAKEASVVTKAPTAKTLTYNGQAQELVTAGTATGGEMQYALGTKDDVTEEYTTSIPTATEVGTYYVWYKAVGDSDHSDSEAKAITVTIKIKGEAHTHTIKLVDAKEPTCTEDGYKEHYECTECGAWFGDITGVSEITDKSGYTIKAIGHKWGAYEVTKRPTYDEEGLKTYTCENDPSHTKEETIPKLTSSSSSDSDSDSGSSGGSGSKNNNVSKQVIDVNGNIKSNVPSNHQVESGVPASDVGGRWANSADADTWTYTKSDGTLAKSEWMSLDYNGLRYWYYFDASGNMQTNWFDYNGKKFYLMPDKDGWRGRMATGWKKIDNKWYYFDITPGETQGSMYTAAITPDGHTVGADGAWNGVGATPVGQE